MRELYLLHARTLDLSLSLLLLTTSTNFIQTMSDLDQTNNTTGELPASLIVSVAVAIGGGTILILMIVQLWLLWRERIKKAQAQTTASSQAERGEAGTLSSFPFRSIATTNQRPSHHAGATADKLEEVELYRTNTSCSAGTVREPLPVYTKE